MSRTITAGALVAILALVAPSTARASPKDRHLVRVDVLEIVAGRPPTTRHFDLFVASDGALVQTHAGAYTLAARWNERQDGKPMMTLAIDRSGSVPMHTTGRFRPFLGVPTIRFGSGTKGMLTEVLVTVT